MSNLISTNVEENEIVKADDLNNGYNASITNITNTLKAIFEHRQDFVVGGEISAYTGMGISIKPVFGICTNDENGDPAADVVLESEEKINVATVSQGYSVNRIDTVEIRGNFVGTTQQQRAFIDFETSTQTLQNVMTKNEVQLEIKIKKNADDGIFHSSAPDKDDGWIKIAEIFVPANCNDIDLCTINNISADIYDMENTEWTSEKKVTYNIGRISDINERFRIGHNKDGSHKAGVIGKNEINRTGTDSNKVTASDFQLGGDITASGTTKSATDSILSGLQMLATKINDLFTPYLSNGAFKFQAGEIIISKSAAYDAATAVKIGANGNGTAYLKIGDTKIFDITAAGQIRMKSDYSATNTLDLVTKSVTDALATRMTTAETNISNLSASMDNTKIFSNETLSRIKYRGYVRLATTGNITLSGLQTIDSVSVSAGEQVLVKNQTNAVQNGIYEVQTGAWNRLTGFGPGNENNFKNSIFYIAAGSSNAGKAFYLALENFTIGTTELTFLEANFSISNIAGKIVMRDKDGNFSAGTITASLNGKACCADCATIATSVKNHSSNSLLCFNNIGCCRDTNGYLWGWGVEGSGCVQELYCTSCISVGFAGAAKSGSSFVVNCGYGITDSSGNGLLALAPNSWTGVSAAYWGLGSIEHGGIIRSSGNNLYHYRYDCSRSYQIWDCSNFNPASYLPLSGGTMTGGITMLCNRYKCCGSGYLNMSNSDIVGANHIWFDDTADDPGSEGISFLRSDLTNVYDTIDMCNGYLYFTRGTTRMGCIPNDAIKGYCFNGNATSATSAINICNKNGTYNISFQTAGVCCTPYWVWGWGLEDNCHQQELYYVKCLPSGFVFDNYASTDTPIYLGYAGAGLTCTQISHLAAFSTNYTTGKTIIKDASKTTIQSWLGLGSAAYCSASAFALGTGGIANCASSATLAACAIHADLAAWADRAICLSIEKAECTYVGGTNCWCVKALKSGLYMYGNSSTLLSSGTTHGTGNACCVYYIPISNFG